MVFLLFPSGRLLTPGWRRVVWLLAAALTLGVPGYALGTDDPNNPLAVGGVAIELLFAARMLLLMCAWFAAIASLVIRYRRAVGVERLLLKQLVFASAAILPVMLLAVPSYVDSVVIQAVVGLSLLALPAAVGLAILRYGLYDIDVVINRTLVYGALTATLAGSYLASVLCCSSRSARSPKARASRSPLRRWPSRRRFGPSGRGSRASSIAASFEASTTPPVRWSASARSRATRSTSRRSATSRAPSSRRRCRRPTSRSGCEPRGMLRNAFGTPTS